MTIKSSSILDNKVDPYILPTLKLDDYLQDCEILLVSKCITKLF